MSQHRQKKGTPAKASRVRERALELLDDEQWHSYERIIARLIPLVPPGQAYRAAEDRRKWAAVKRYGEVRPRQKNVDSAQIIRTGARALVVAVLKGGKEFEISPRTDGEKRRIRLHKDRMSYYGWRKPEDVTPRVRTIVQMLQRGTPMPEIAAHLGCTESTVTAGLKGAAKQVGLDTSSQYLVPKLLVDRGMVPPPPPMDDLERKWVDDARRHSSPHPELMSARLKISRDEEWRVRRRLMVRWGVPTMQEMVRRIRDGELKEE